MNIPQDASPDVQQFAREVIEAIGQLRGTYAIIPGTKIVGASDATILSGVVTLRQLQSLRDSLEGQITKVNNLITELKKKNSLV